MLFLHTSKVLINNHFSRQVFLSYEFEEEEEETYSLFHYFTFSPTLTANHLQFEPRTHYLLLNSNRDYLLFFTLNQYGIYIYIEYLTVIYPAYNYSLFEHHTHCVIFRLILYLLVILDCFSLFSRDFFK